MWELPEGVVARKLEEAEGKEKKLKEDPKDDLLSSSPRSTDGAHAVPPLLSLPNGSVEDDEVDPLLLKGGKSPSSSSSSLFEQDECPEPLLLPSFPSSTSLTSPYHPTSSPTHPEYVSPRPKLVHSTSTFMNFQEFNPGEDDESGGKTEEEEDSRRNVPSSPSFPPVVASGGV